MNIWTLCADDDRSKIEQLLNKGTSPNAKDANGYTPLHAAASYAHIELLKLLVLKGGDVNVQDSDGDTPLHHVEDVATAKVLVEELGADYKIRNSEGQTAKELIEDDGEFLDVAEYLQSLVHGGVPHAHSPVDDAQLQLPDGQQIRYEYMSPGDIEIEIDDDKRQQLRQIVEGDNPEEKLKDFLQKQVAEQFYNESPKSKKRRD